METRDTEEADGGTKMQKIDITNECIGEMMCCPERFGEGHIESHGGFTYWVLEKGEESPLIVTKGGHVTGL